MTTQVVMVCVTASPYPRVVSDDTNRLEIFHYSRLANKWLFNKIGTRSDEDNMAQMLAFVERQRDRMTNLGRRAPNVVWGLALIVGAYSIIKFVSWIT